MQLQTDIYGIDQLTEDEKQVYVDRARLEFD